MNHQVLLIEDDKELADLVSRYLSNNGLEVQVINTVGEFKAQFTQYSPDIILCDIMLPDGNGFDLFPILKKNFSCPVIFLTALDSDVSQIKGLNLGANDYLIKPIRPELLLARVNSSLRISGKGEVTKAIGPVKLDTAKRQLECFEHAISLNDDELRLLTLFMQNYPTPLSRETLFKEVIGREYDGLDRAADLKVSRLRRKIRDHGVDGLDIISIRGEGYLMQVPTQPNA
ncbi:response regulator transcription factor [Pseudoalteromonas sp. SSDWG2]|uniref:response regulator transcription factor n=1 Tax=Pseudoalteromonas sp. SSDWG2 TaxID=3139391 RepID=UPI003BAB2E41